MSHGWLVRCDPAAGRFEVELGEGGEEREQDGLAVVRTTARGTGSTGSGDPRRSPAAPVSTAVWSPERRALSLVRDRTGRQPLFHARTGAVVLVSPDLQTLLAQPGVSREPSAIAVAEWLLDRPGPPEETLLTAIRRVPAGHRLDVDAQGVERLTRDWAPAERGTYPAADAGRFGEVLEAAIAGELTGPAAVLLSGGIDSASVAAAAAAASGRAGLTPPRALCADMPEESELETQRRVSDALGLPRTERPFRASPAALDVARAIVSASLWPVQTPWAQVGEQLLASAVADGRNVVFDGNGGDEVLDAGLAPARGFLRRGNLRALVDLARAERGFSGLPPRGVLRAALGRGRSYRPEPLPDWIVDPALVRSLEERAAVPPPDDDLLDTFTAAALESSAMAGPDRGVRHAHPYYDPAVVELLRGLSAEELVRGGQAKSPARTYLRARLPGIQGRWPRPALVSDLLDELVPPRALGETPRLGELGICLPDDTRRPEQLAAGLRWAILSTEGWLVQNSSRGQG